MSTLPNNMICALLSEPFKQKFKALMRDFDALQPDGDTPTSGYLSLNARQALITKHLGPFGFAPKTRVVNYPQGAVVETTLLVRVGNVMVPWFRRYGSASNSQRADGDLAQAGISAWRKVFVAMGLANIAENDVHAKAESRTEVISFISKKMNEMNCASLSVLIGTLRAQVSSFDVKVQDVQKWQLHELPEQYLMQISNALGTLSNRSSEPVKKAVDDGF